jgi:L-fuconolactonase
MSLIVDTHTHVVAPDESAYPFTPRPLTSEWYRTAPCSAPQLRESMDAAGVDRAVLVQPISAYSFDNRYAADSAARCPERFAAACCVDPDGDAPVDELTYWIRDRAMGGVRFFAISTRDSWLADERTVPLWEQAAELGAHVIVTILPQQLPELRTVLQRFPAIAMSLDHCAFPDPAAPEPLFAFAEYPNLHLKVTTHVLDAAAEQGGDPAPFVSEIVRHFGAERVMWGSDFSQTHNRPYGELVGLAHRGFAALSVAERAACMGGTALGLWPTLVPSS